MGHCQQMLADFCRKCLNAASSIPQSACLWGYVQNRRTLTLVMTACFVACMFELTARTHTQMCIRYVHYFFRKYLVRHAVHDVLRTSGQRVFVVALNSHKIYMQLMLYTITNATLTSQLRRTFPCPYSILNPTLQQNSHRKDNQKIQLEQKPF